MLKILGRANSVNVQKVLWCADELGLSYERIDVGGEFGGNQTSEYLAKNPNGVVPTIEDDGLVLWESNSIVRYLAAKHGAGGLWPNEAARRAMADRWMDWQLTTLGPEMRHVFWGLVRTPPEKRDSVQIESARRALLGIWGRLDRYLEHSAFVAGDSLTIGDIPVGCFVYRWFNLPLERNHLPHLEAWYRRLATRPAFKKNIMIVMT
jgi:glutathione S-transferase